MFYGDRVKETGRRIKKCRTALHMTQTQLLKKVHLSEKTVASLRSWERGERLPDMETLARMCDVFDCDFGYLIADYDEKRRETADVCGITGLSEKAVDTLREMKGSADNCPSGSLAVGAHRLQALNLLLETKEGARFFEIAYAFLFGQYDLVNVYSPDVSNECENTYARLIDSTGHADSVSVQAKDMTAMFVLRMQTALMELKSKIQDEKDGR